jgi:hypothetical protein
MTTATRATKAEAQKAFNALVKAWGGKKGVNETFANPPKLLRNWNFLGPAYDWAIVWEEGPYEWAHLFPYGGIDEEFGLRVPDMSDRTKGVHIEAITSWAVAIYPRDW